MIITLMAAYNAEKTIIETINSFLESEKNVYFNNSKIEGILWIIDDGSKDNTFKLVKNYIKKFNLHNVHIFKNEENKGILKTREILLKDAYFLSDFLESIGEAKKENIILTYLDSDDLYTKESLNIRYNFLMKNKEYMVIGGQTELFEEVAHEEYTLYNNYGVYSLYPNSYEEVKVHSLFQSNSLIGLLSIRLKYIENLMWNNKHIWTKNKMGEDWSFIVENFKNEKFKFCNLKDMLMYYRRHSNQMTNNMTDSVHSDQANIRNKMFRYINLEPSEKEHLLHIAISPCRHWDVVENDFFWENIDSIIEKTKKWFIKIRESNKKTKFLNEKILNSYMSIILSDLKLKVDLAKKGKIQKKVKLNLIN